MKEIGEIVAQLEGQPARNVKLGHGSFITMDFGKDISIQIETSKGVRNSLRGEWHLWVYMCGWRLDKYSTPHLGSNDEFSRDIFQSRLSELENRKLISFKILNQAFDAQLNFETNLVLHLFSYSTEDRQWMLFAPDEKVFTAGPGKKWSYIQE